MCAPAHTESRRQCAVTFRFIARYRRRANHRDRRVRAGANRTRVGSVCGAEDLLPGIGNAVTARAAMEFSEFRHPFVCCADRGITPPESTTLQKATAQLKSQDSK